MNMLNKLSNRTRLAVCRKAGMENVGSVESFVAYITQYVIDGSKDRPELPCYWHPFGIGKVSYEEIVKLCPEKIVVKIDGISTKEADAYLEEKLKDRIYDNVYRQKCIETCLKIIESVSDKNAESICYEVANTALVAILNTVDTKPLGNTNLNDTDISGLIAWERANNFIKAEINPFIDIVKTLKRNRVLKVYDFNKICNNQKLTDTGWLDHWCLYTTQDGKKVFTSSPYADKSCTNQINSVKRFCKENDLELEIIDSFYSPGCTMYVIKNKE